MDTGQRVIGHIDGVLSPTSFFGWALDPADFKTPLALQVTLRGTPVRASFVRRQRADLRACQPNRAGFVATIEDPVSALDWLRGEVACHAGHSQDSLHAIPLGRQAAQEIGLMYCAHQQGALDAARAATMLDSMAAALEADEATRVVLQNAAKAIRRPPEKLSFDAGTQVIVPVGVRSQDCSAMIGHAGHAFLVGGTNHVLSQYEDAQAGAEDDAISAGWLAVFQARAAHIRAAGPSYLQVIVPEKLSVLPDFYTHRVQTPSRHLRALEAQLLNDDVLGRHYLSAHRVLVSAPDRTCLFQTIDTHLSEPGCYRLFCAMLDKLGLQLPDDPVFTLTETYVPGDLADRFFDVPLLQKSYTVTGLDPRLDNAALQLIDSEEAVGDRHIGIRRHWRNPSSMSPLRVLAFGNSFFGRAGEPRNLSWWFARYFREFHFIWRPGFQAEWVDRQKPDIVVCQTIERFLPTVPDL